MPTFEQICNYAREHDPRECQPQITARRHSFIHAEENKEEIIILNNQLFNEGVLRQGRDDVFNKWDDEALFPLSVLYWGFPTNMHGIGTRMCESYERVRSICQYIRSNSSITSETFLKVLVPQLESCRGLGLSFFSKLFYFSGLRIDGDRCTILDKKVRDTILLSTDERLSLLRRYCLRSYFSYPNYAAEVEKLANQIGCNPDCVEYALFTGAQL